MQFLPKEVILPSQIFGWFPLRYVDNSDNRSIEFSWSWCVWGFTLTLTYSTLSLRTLHDDLRGRLEWEPIREVTDTSEFTILMDRSILCTVGMVVFISTVMRYPQCIETHDVLQKLDNALQLVRNNKLQPKIILFFTAKVTVALVSFSYYSSFYPGYFEYTPYWVSYFAQATVVMFFINACSVLKERFCIINEKIRKEVIKQSFGQLLRVEGVGENHGNAHCVSDGASSLSEIRRLTDLYWLLCGLVRSANRFFSWHLFVGVMSLSIHTITALFNLFGAIWPGMKQETIAQAMIRSLWVMVNTFELLLILGTSTSMTDMAHSTAPMVCKLVNRNLSPPLKRHLEVFLLSLRHQNAKFSALGLFQVQNHILTPIAGAIMTYLVILIQFQARNTYGDSGNSS